MKIIVDYKNTLESVISVTNAIYIGDYVLNILFSEGTNQNISFKKFLSNSIHPSINKYYNEPMFTQFKIVDGNLIWNDYDMIFPIEDLYEGKI